ncbi:peptidase T [Aerococcaceae bacterium NML130460]|nr:peptidase T [Aerococcaceae bacterium NML130460]
MRYSTMLERFIRYAKMNTRSDIHSNAIPTTPNQVAFAMMLVDELQALGFEEVYYDERDAFVTAKLASNCPERDIPAIGWIAHIDTADYPSENVQPLIHPNYNGQDVLLNAALDKWLTVAEFPNLTHYIGETLITTDGTTLLGADDKAGMVSIIEAAKYLIEHPDLPHGDLWFAFGPDEEIGKGAHRFVADKFPAQFAYTLDSGVVGKFEYETFNAARATLTFTGTSVHPGQAKNVMVNALAEAAKFFARLPQDEVPEKTSGYEGFFMLSNQQGNLDHVVATYIIRDHDQDKFAARKQLMYDLVAQQNATYDMPRITCEIYDEYYNMADIIQQDMTPVNLALEAYRACGITPDVQPFRGGTDGCIITYKGIPTPNIFTGAENLHGCYEFITLESMQKASDVVLKIIELATESATLKG